MSEQTLDAARETLSEAHLAVAHAVGTHEEELRSIRLTIHQRGDADQRAALDDILSALDHWKRAGNAFLDAVGREATARAASMRRVAD